MVTIKGVSLDSIQIAKEDGETHIKGEYSLISSADKVLAKQSFNGFQGMKVVFTPNTIGMLKQFIAAAKADLETMLGFREAEGDGQ